MEHAPKPPLKGEVARSAGGVPRRIGSSLAITRQGTAGRAPLRRSTQSIPEIRANLRKI